MRAVDSAAWAKSCINPLQWAAWLPARACRSLLKSWHVMSLKCEMASEPPTILWAAGARVAPAVPSVPTCNMAGRSAHLMRWHAAQTMVLLRSSSVTEFYRMVPGVLQHGAIPFMHMLQQRCTPQSCGLQLSHYTSSATGMQRPTESLANGAEGYAARLHGLGSGQLQPWAQKSFQHGGRTTRMIGNSAVRASQWRE